jgi:AcrR family transcriptional regulator
MTDDGLDRVTMRALSARLVVAPSAVYGYFRDKSALLDGLLDNVIGEVKTSGLDSMGWREGLLELMGRSRRVVLEHAELLPQLLSHSTRGPNAIRLGEATLELLSRPGVHGEQGGRGHADPAGLYLRLRGVGGAATRRP